ncbi:MAG: phosphoglycerate mutase family protein, partial [Pseudomonadota bacterium]
IYLVRHAEKQAGPDPSLTAAGQARAERLADILADKGLTQIHSTNLKRTLETAAPIAARAGLPVSLYEADDLDAFAETLAASPGAHLVVGHSNTTPPLAAALGGDPGDEIDEASEYDRLYVITLDAGEITSEIERFGVRYDAAATAPAE